MARTIGPLFLVAVFVTATLACSAERSSPLLSQRDVARPSATPAQDDTPLSATPSAEEDAVAAASAEFDEFGFDYKDTMRVAQWDDTAVQVANMIVGYILVQGYVYEAELVEVADGDYQAALESGEVDAVLKVDRADAGEWYEDMIGNGTAIDAGSLWGVGSDLRIVVRKDFADRAPEIAELLPKILAGAQRMDSVVANVRPGRVGVKPNAAAIGFFKQHRPVWTAWVSTEAAADIDRALSENLTGLFRNCLDTESGQGAFVWCK